MGLEVSKKDYQKEILSLSQSEIRALLSEVYVKSYLNEGIFDKLIDFIGQLASAYASGASRADLSRRIDVKDGLDPKNKIEDQVAALICLLQSVGYAAEGLEQELGFIEQSLESSWDQMDDNQFIEEAQLFIKRASEAYGRFHAWIGNGGRNSDSLARCSRTVHSIGLKLEEAPETLNLGFEMIDRVIGELAALNIASQTANILRQEGAQKALKDIQGQRFIDETLPLIQMLPTLQPRVKVVAENLFQIQELMRLKQEKPVEAPAVG